MMEEPKTAELVIVDYDDLVADKNSSADEDNNDLMLKNIERAFGKEGCGILGIRNVPSFVQAKQELLALAHPLAHLPANQLAELEDPNSLYNAGWSHGKEKLKADIPDTAKASFYFNPITDLPGTENDRELYPVSYPINKWPKEGLPELEPAAKRLGCLMKDVAVHLAKHIDTYAHSCHPNYVPSTLYNAMKDTEKVKGRLLYYFPLHVNNDNDSTSSSSGDQVNTSEDSWIGWHNDSGFLTALAGDVYMTPDGTILDDQYNHHHPSLSYAGLYAVDRKNNVLKVDIPKDCMAIQMGECTQIITGGAVVATPHCVRGAPNLARATLACFIDVPPSCPLAAPDGSDRNAILTSSSRVPPLEARWTDQMTFGSFLQKTFEMYYDWNK